MVNVVDGQAQVDGRGGFLDDQGVGGQVGTEGGEEGLVLSLHVSPRDDVATDLNRQGRHHVHHAAVDQLRVLVDLAFETQQLAHAMLMVEIEFDAGDLDPQVNLPRLSVREYVEVFR